MAYKVDITYDYPPNPQYPPSNPQYPPPNPQYPPPNPQYLPPSPQYPPPSQNPQYTPPPSKAPVSNGKLQKIRPFLLNGWVNFGTWEEAGIYKNSDGEVRCEGLIKGDFSKIIFVFPEGFRPKKGHIFNLNANNKAYRVDVNSKGEVFFTTNGHVGSVTGSGFLSLDGLAFYI